MKRLIDKKKRVRVSALKKAILRHREVKFKKKVELSEGAANSDGYETIYETETEMMTPFEEEGYTDFKFFQLY